MRRRGLPWQMVLWVTIILLSVTIVSTGSYGQDKVSADEKENNSDDRDKPVKKKTGEHEGDKKKDEEAKNQPEKEKDIILKEIVVKGQQLLKKSPYTIN